MSTLCSCILCPYYHHISECGFFHVWCWLFWILFLHGTVELEVYTYLRLTKFQCSWGLAYAYFSEVSHAHLDSCHHRLYKRPGWRGHRHLFWRVSSDSSELWYCCILRNQWPGTHWNWSVLIRSGPRCNISACNLPLKHTDVKPMRQTDKSTWWVSMETQS